MADPIREADATEIDEDLERFRRETTAAFDEAVVCYADSTIEGDAHD